MTIVDFYGVDPGLVDTGVVNLFVRYNGHRLEITEKVVKLADADEVASFINDSASTQGHQIYVEKYKPRNNFGNSVPMLELQQRLKTALPSSTKFILNTGVKQVVRRPLLELLGLWSFHTSTNHDDLRSAARIMVYGMLKDDATNTILADIIRDTQTGDPWNVTHH